MNTRHVRFCLITFGSSALAAGGLLLVWSLLVSCEIAGPRTEAARGNQRDSTNVVHKPVFEVTPGDFEPYWERRLRDASVSQQLTTTAPMVNNQQQIAGLPFKLLATLIEPEKRSAVFSTGNNAIEIAAAGATFGKGALQAEVIKIERQKAVVKYQQRVYQLALDGEQKN